MISFLEIRKYVRTQFPNAKGEENKQILYRLQGGKIILSLVISYTIKGLVIKLKITIYFTAAITKRMYSL